MPVGDDQRQHVELARDLAVRFNTRYGATFTVPEAVHPPVAARVLDLAAPGAKMSKSSSSAAGSLRLLDPPELLRRKVMRARTDAATTVAYDPSRAPGVANLLDILAGCTGEQPTQLAARFDGYGELKRAVADAVVGTLAPLRERYLQLAAEPERVRAVLRARRRAGPPPRGRHRAPGPHGDRAPAVLKPRVSPIAHGRAPALATVGASRMRGLDRGVRRIGAGHGSVRVELSEAGAAAGVQLLHGWRAAAAERLGPTVLQAFAAAVLARLQAQAAGPPPAFDFTAAAARARSAAVTTRRCCWPTPRRTSVSSCGSWPRCTTRRAP